MRYAELFAGVGGLSLGLDRAGWECAFHAEIADFPRRVLKHRWPDTPLYGDVAKLDGRELVERHGPIDLLSGGSPCQDLSVAGKRKGMAEGSGTRSSLFYEQLRLWNETEAEFLLWENVDGARSSNEGKDFGAVLSALVGAPVFVPTDGWRSGGVAAGPSGIAAWRVLDAQYFGVPQRRRRVFVLCSRTGRVDPAEVLSLSEGLRGNPAASGEAREGFAGSAGNGVEGEGRIAATLVSPGQQFNSFQNLPNLIVALDTYNQDESERVELDKSKTPAVIAFTAKDSGHDAGFVSPTLRAGSHKNSHDSGGVMPAVLSVPATLNTRTCKSVGADDAANGHIIANETGHESWRIERVAGSLNAHESKEAHSITLHGIPRRLMPIECERLMGWPDNWTNVPDEKGKAASDAVRYRACGNGVVSAIPEWIGRRILPLLGV